MVKKGHQSVQSVKNRVKLFPHIPRFISASAISITISILLFGFLALLFYVNINYLSQQNLTIRLISSLSPDIYIKEAERLWLEGKTETAIKELRTAKSLKKQFDNLSYKKTNTVLGVSTDDNSIVIKWQVLRDQKEKEYQYWKSVLLNHKDYRDAYVHFAQAATILGKNDEAKDALSKAKQIDPNNKYILEIEGIISDTK
jgi:hypothetical protein